MSAFWVSSFLLLSLGSKNVDSFVVPSKLTATTTVASTSTQLGLADSTKNSRQAENKKTFQGKRNKKKKITIGDLRKELMKDPQSLQNSANQKKKGSRRTRKRTDNPKQTYMYASQRAKFGSNKDKNRVGDQGECLEDAATEAISSLSILEEARGLGLIKAANQHCDAVVDSTLEPKIVGQVRVDETSTAGGAFAYLIDKPAGWSILGSSGRGPTNSVKNKKQQQQPTSSGKNKKKNTQGVKIKGGNFGKDDYLEFNPDDVLALLSPAERAELEAEGGLEAGLSMNGRRGPAYDDTTTSTFDSPPGWYDVAKMTPDEREEAGIEDEDWDPTDIPEFNEEDVLALLSPEEREEYDRDKQNANPSVVEPATMSLETNKNRKKKDPLRKYHKNVPREELDTTVQENLKRIETRLKENANSKASFAVTSKRPSVVAWLKEFKAAEGTPIRGGTYWKAIAGATDVDDSGLVLICPKSNVDNVFIDFCDYTTVIGNGQYLSPKPKNGQKEIPKEFVEINMLGKVRKFREGDSCQTVKITIPEHFSTCSSIIPHVQSQFADGIRGDPAANPLDRRASRRLIHCKAISVSSLVVDDHAQFEAEYLPDDIAILAERLNHHKYKQGSFLGRSQLRKNPLTNAYREINGAADGFPGWTVDRYADWLFVQHDDKEYKGPLPSIHDGNTVGVYYLPANPDRGAMGVNQNIRPMLLEGKAAPDDFVPILENGVTYHVSLDKDLSTGIFLDQRLHRAWLTRHCSSETHVLNCFAHCGAFSIAAATAGASTVSLDLNKKWLDRVRPQLEANGIEFDERHDCIYGDCKCFYDWR